jgi:hypothetical protein
MYKKINRMNYLTKKVKSIIIGGGMAAVALFVSMLSPLNPFSRSVPGIDSSVYLTVAQGILDGKLPYVDFFDHKGPLVYFIDALGLYIGGFTGVWLLELLFTGISVFFAYKTARFFGNKLVALMGTVFTFVVTTESYGDGSLTMMTTKWVFGECRALPEGYALPLIFISLYIFTKHYFTKIELSKMQITVLGFCFAFSLLLKPNMFAVWAAFCAVIFFRKLSQKDYKTVRQYILFFLLGLFILFIPIGIYLKYTDSYDEFIQQYWRFNVAYASPTAGMFLHVKILIWIINKSLLPVIIVPIWLLKKPHNTSYDFYLAYTLALFASILLIAIGIYGYLNYCIVFIPLFVPAMTFCFEQLFKLFSSAKYSCIKYGVPILIACVLFNKLIFTTILYLGGNIYNESRNTFIQMGKFIDDNTNDNESITVLGNNCAVYLFTERPSVSKYIYQTPIMYVDPKVKNDYIFDVTHRKPVLIIVPSNDFEKFFSTQDIFSPILEMIDKEYFECFKSERYVIFKRSEQRL